METHFDAMTSESQDARERVKEDLHALMRDAEELLKATAGDMSEKAKLARTRLAERRGESLGPEEDDRRFAAKSREQTEVRVRTGFFFALYP
jgi:ElaB/YqjD/DUF883 family membrane-anchored ribosome-binding protein